MAIYKSPFTFSSEDSLKKPPQKSFTANENGTTIVSNSPYAPITSLSALSSSAPLSFTTPTPIQSYAIPVLQHNHSVMVRAPTGMGKTLCFLLPVIQNIRYSNMGIQLCVVVPTRELCEQIKTEARRLTDPRKLRVEAIYGGQRRLSNYRSVDILIAAPGRLLDCLGSSSISFSSLRYFVLDEADKLLDMGFESNLRDIKSYVPSTACVSLFSATYHKNLQPIIEEFLPEDRISIEIKNETVKTIRQSIIEVTDRNAQLMGILNNLRLSTVWGKESEMDRVIVFVERKSTAKTLEEFLKKQGVSCMSLHGDKLQTERNLVFQRYKAGLFPVLVATSVAARGIDIKDVRVVVNYEMPRDIKEYIHRIGRTGREGKEGEAISFMVPDELSSDMRRELINVLKESGNEVPAAISQPMTRRGADGRREQRPRGPARATQSEAVEPITKAFSNLTVKEKDYSDEDFPGEW